MEEYRGFGTKIRFWGKRALFTRPEFKTERFSYEVMTPSAATGMLEAIFWHPGLHYVIDRIYVCKPIQFQTIKKNEVDSKGNLQDFEKMISGGTPPSLITSEHISQRNTTFLTDVDYVVECHFDMTDRANASDNPGKFAEMLRRRASKGQCFSQPYLGTKDFAANFSLWPENKEIPTITDSKNLGVMLHSMDYSDPANIHPRFFMAELQNGVMEVAGRRVFE